ncbi:hypothetical protein U0R10_02080 [Aquirufa sp. OSTEICH-129V]|uniref:Uncharacterized protein n=1 Tax=Aquirufa avitistagni TaxID=3104728 RepID=A0ABW6DHC9_9BACT
MDYQGLKSKDIFELETKISKGQFPNEFQHFGGANLIITDEPDRPFYSGDIVVYSIHASALSWLVEELAAIKSTQLNYSVKYEFYPRIGELLIEDLKNSDDIIEIMLTVASKVNSEW